MRIDRLVIGGNGSAVALALHPRLTVVTGLDPAARELLAAELLGALRAGRQQVHVEITDDGGRRLAVVRPAHDAARVVDVAGARDVTDEFTADGQLDLLAGLGMPADRPTERLRLTAADLQRSREGDRLVQRLAELDQSRLWAAATAVQVTDDQLRARADQLGALRPHPDLVEQVELSENALAAATERARASMRRLRIITASAAVIGLAVIGLDRAWLAIPCVLAAMVALVASVRSRRRADLAAAASRTALDEVGSSSYLAFHLQHVSGILRDDQDRRRLLSLARDAREASTEWAALAGDVPVEWAFAHQDEIRASAGIHADLQTVETLSGSSPGASENEASDLAHVLVARLRELRALGPDGESFPLVLDEPFAGVTESVKPALLELLLRHAGSPQLVFLTGDEQISSWARVEVLTGELAVVDPNSEPSLT